MNTSRFDNFVVSVFSMATGFVLFLFFLIVLSGSVYASSNGVVVSGTVYYSTTPLSNVKVELISGTVTSPATFSTTTSISGTYAFISVPAGNYWLKVYGPTSEYIGWSAISLVVQDQNIQRDFHLAKVMTLISPAQNSLVEDTKPLFCWQGLPEATKYTFQLNKTSDWTLVDFVHNIRTTCFKTTAVLTNSVQFTWQVDAYDIYGSHIGTTNAAFRFTVNTTPIVTAITPNVPITISSRDNSINIQFAAGVVTQTSVLTYTRNSATLPVSSFIGVNRSFYVTATQQNTGFPVVFADGSFYTLTVTYEDMERGAAIEDSLALYWWDGSQWVKESNSIVDTTSNTVTATPNHFSLWALLGETRRLFLPLISR